MNEPPSLLNFPPQSADMDAMPVNAWNPAPPPPPAVWLDGQPVALPARVVGSLPGICSELETLAASRQRVLAGVWVDGLPADLLVGQAAGGPFQRVEAQSISLAELSRRLAGETRSQTRELRWAVESAVLGVLINEPAHNRQRWQRFQGELREVLAQLGMLRELWGARLGELAVGGHDLDAHLEELGHIAGHIELLLLKPDAEALPASMLLSNVFERSLAPWLRRLEDYLGDLYELNLD